MTFTKGQSYDINFVINGDLRTVQAVFTGTVSECKGEDFLRFERTDGIGRLRVYQISQKGWETMQLTLKGEAGSHDEYSF